MVFAKDKNQAVLAIIVLAIFVINTIVMISKSVSQNMRTADRRSEANIIAQQQKQNLESLNVPDNTPPAQNDISDDLSQIYNETVNLQQNPNLAENPQVNKKEATANDEDIEIMPKKKAVKKDGKTVLISVKETGRENPFMPLNDFNSSVAYSLVSPPTETYPNSNADKVMSTTISGILYDTYSPSAIINIQGTDYLVKKGDVINHYKVLSIEKEKVLVQLGKNIYKAGVGELLSQSNVNYNTVANLNKKFAGNDVTINVRKKGY